MKPIFSWIDEKLFGDNISTRTGLYLRIGLSIHIIFSYVYLLINFDPNLIIYSDAFLNGLFSQPLVLYGSILLTIVCAMALFAGLLSEIAIFCLFLLTSILPVQLPDIMAGNDYVVKISLLFLLFLSPSDHFSLDAFLFRRKQRRQVPRWCILNFSFLISAIYFSANIHRLGSMHWEQGWMALSLLKNNTLSYFSHFHWQDYSTLLMAGTFFARGMEIWGIFLPLMGKYRKHLSTALIGLHLSLALLINISGWQFFMIALHLSSFYNLSSNSTVKTPVKSGFGTFRFKLILYIGTVILVYFSSIPKQLLLAPLVKFQTVISKFNTTTQLIPTANLKMFNRGVFLNNVCYFIFEVDNKKLTSIYQSDPSECFSLSHKFRKDFFEEMLNNIVIRRSQKPQFKEKVGPYLCKLAQKKIQKPHNIIAFRSVNFSIAPPYLASEQALGKKILNTKAMQMLSHYSCSSNMTHSWESFQSQETLRVLRKHIFTSPADLYFKNTVDINGRKILNN